MAITLTRTASRVHPDGMSPDPEVPGRPQRRRYTAAYKLQILEEADRAAEPGQIGALLRGEGLYSSPLASWRQQRRDGTLVGQVRGRKGKDARDRKIEELERDNVRLTRKLDQAEPSSRSKKLAAAGDRADDRRGHRELMIAAVCELEPGDRHQAGLRCARRHARDAVSHQEPTAGEPHSGAQAVAPGAIGARAHPRARRLALTSILRHRSGGSGRHAARRGHLPRLGAHHVPHPRGFRGAGSATTSSPITNIRPELLATASNRCGDGTSPSSRA